MALADVLDFIAARLRNEIDGLKGAYSPGSSGEDARVMPRSVDTGPLAFVLPGSSSAEAGNAETEVHDVVVRFYVHCAPGSEDFAFKTIVPFPARVKEMCRTQVATEGAVDRLLYTGYDPFEFDYPHGKPFLTLDVRLEALELHMTDDYSS